MKRLGKKKEGDISPDLTSFSDIANLLIIFFILTTSLVRPFGRQVDIPSAAAPQQQDKKKQSDETPTVNLTVEKIMYAEGEGKEREITMNELRAELWKKNFPQQEPSKRSVVLEASPDVPYERYYHVVTAIAAAGGVVAVMEEDGK